MDDDLMISRYLEGSALLIPRCCTRINGTKIQDHSTSGHPCLKQQSVRMLPQILAFLPLSKDGFLMFLSPCEVQPLRERIVAS